MPSTKTETPGRSEQESARSQAYQKAQSRLRDAHIEEWHALVAEEYEAVGLVYRRRLTPQEKAAAQIEALLLEFPDLRGQYDSSGMDEFAATR